MSNGSKKMLSSVLVVVGTLFTLGVAVVFAMSFSTNSDQAEHESDLSAHGIDRIASDISTISSNVQMILIQQGVQAETMKNMAQDIAELKEGK